MLPLRVLRLPHVLCVRRVVDRRRVVLHPTLTPTPCVFDAAVKDAAEEEAETCGTLREALRLYVFVAQLRKVWAWAWARGRGRRRGLGRKRGRADGHGVEMGISSTGRHVCGRRHESATRTNLKPRK